METRHRGIKHFSCGEHIWVYIFKWSQCGRNFCPFSFFLLLSLPAWCLATVSNQVGSRRKRLLWSLTLCWLGGRFHHHPGDILHWPLSILISKLSILPDTGLLAQPWPAAAGGFAYSAFKIKAAYTCLASAENTRIKQKKLNKFPESCWKFINSGSSGVFRPAEPGPILLTSKLSGNKICIRYVLLCLLQGYSWDLQTELDIGTY